MAMPLVRASWQRCLPRMRDRRDGRDEGVIKWSYYEMNKSRVRITNNSDSIIGPICAGKKITGNQVARPLQDGHSYLVWRHRLEDAFQCRNSSLLARSTMQRCPWTEVEYTRGQKAVQTAKTAMTME